MTEKLMSKIVSELIPILPTLLSVFIGATLGFISAFVIDLLKAKRSKEEHNRQLRENVYKDCIEFCNRLDYDKLITASVDKVMNIRASLDLFASKNVKKHFISIIDKILRPEPEEVSKDIILLVNAMRKELGIKD